MSTPIEVQGAILSESQDGKRILEISSKTGQIRLEFSPRQWALLEDSARWFHDMPGRYYLNGKAKTDV